MTRIAGIDVGGTFTDLIFVDDETGEVRLAKIERIIESLKSPIAIGFAAGEVVFVLTEKHSEHLEGVGNIAGGHLAAGNHKTLPKA